MLDGSTTLRTETTTDTGTIGEVFRAEVKVAAAAADTALLLNLLTDPNTLIVLGDTGISFKLDAAGTDAIAADPMAVICNADAGLAINQILLSNSDSAEHTVTVYAFEA
jgi:hypothetical protein